MIIITDILQEPFDEGAKIATRNLVENIKFTNTAFTVSINSLSRLPFIDAYFQLNKLLFSLIFYKTLRGIQHAKILYIPDASTTLFSIIRAKLINLFSGKDVCILALQPREYSLLTQGIARFIPPKIIVTQSTKSAAYLTRMGIPNTILPLGVDDRKYCEFTSVKKRELRDKYILNQDKKVLLHVGHIQKSRNLDWLTDIKKDNSEIEIIVVGSTYNQDDETTYSELIEAGIRIIKEYTPDMEELYNVSDYYIFPVLRDDGAIETPLSVLEAMACNLPIITTKFGSLPDTFAEDSDFHYVNNAQEIIEIVGKQRVSSCKNREKISPFTWKEIARKLVDIVEQ
jgi:glycosyltransferase involved in cell wall biosynthesis